MTSVLFTTDTELSFMLHRRGASPLENLCIAVMGEVSDGAWGIGYQMQRLSEHGIKGVFFVEALSSYLFGIDVLKRVVAVILEAGHEVQLHLHAEWLKWIEKDIVDTRRGLNLADLTFDDQRRLLSLGLEALVRAGAPRPTAFRAGNYGANNDTLKALAHLGFTYDSSYNHPYLGASCHICAPDALNRPTRIEGVTEVPVTFFEDYPGHTRALQLCAASAAELKTVVDQSIAQQRPTTVIVSHCFELLNLRRTRANRMLLRRFDRYCEALAARSSKIATADFAKLSTMPNGNAAHVKPLKSSPARTAWRMIEQSVGTILYDRR